MRKPEARPWYRITAKADGAAEILIYDEILGPFWTDLLGIGVSAKSFSKELKDLGDITALDIRINSPGGDVFEGQAIYSLLKAHKARKTVHVDGLAASIASVIAMAGDEILIPENGMMMIHQPLACMCGNALDMRKLADDLDKVSESIAAVYARKTGKPTDELLQLMNEETWMTAAEAVELGFADRQTEAVQMAASAEPFNLSKFRKVPSGMQPAARADQPPVITTKEERMDPINIQLITEKYPDIAAHFIGQGKAAGLTEGEKKGVDAERERIKGIRSVALTIPDMAMVALELMELGVSVDQATTTMKTRRLNTISNAAPESAGGGTDPVDTATLSGEAKWKAEWAQNKGGVQQEFKDEKTFLAYKKADASGRVRIHGSRGSR